MPPFCRLPCRPPVRGVQFHHPVPAAADGSEEVGKDYRHMSADLQVCAGRPVLSLGPLPGQCTIGSQGSCFQAQGSAWCIAAAVSSTPPAGAFHASLGESCCCVCMCVGVFVSCVCCQVSGEAQYTDDVSLPPNTLHAAFVTSTKPHAKLLGVDASAALAMPGGGRCCRERSTRAGTSGAAVTSPPPRFSQWLPTLSRDTAASLSACPVVLAVRPLPGVVGYFGADDVPGDNMIGPIMHDEEVFATKEVTCVGQVRSPWASPALCSLVQWPASQQHRHAARIFGNVLRHRP